MIRRVLLTGFAPFAGLARNPSGDLARRLARDPACRAAGLRTAVLPVERRLAPERLHRLIDRHRPEILLLTGVAEGREAIGFERTAVNVWRPKGQREEGRPIRKGGPDGLFASAPAAASLAALRRGPCPAEISESAGTFTCNLVLYESLLRERERQAGARRPAPTWTAFVHLPATPNCRPDLPEGVPTLELAAMASSLRGLVLGLVAAWPR